VWSIDRLRKRTCVLGIVPWQWSRLTRRGPCGHTFLNNDRAFGPKIYNGVRTRIACYHVIRVANKFKKQKQNKTKHLVVIGYVHARNSKMPHWMDIGREFDLMGRILVPDVWTYLNVGVYIVKDFGDPCFFFPLSKTVSYR
jgi:hypothetical protein